MSSRGFCDVDDGVPVGTWCFDLLLGLRGGEGGWGVGGFWGRGGVGVGRLVELD